MSGRAALNAAEEAGVRGRGTGDVSDVYVISDVNIMKGCFISVVCQLRQSIEGSSDTLTISSHRWQLYYKEWIVSITT